MMTCQSDAIHNGVQAGTHTHLTPMYTHSGCITEYDINLKNVELYKARHDFL